MKTEEEVRKELAFSEEMLREYRGRVVLLVIILLEQHLETLRWVLKKSDAEDSS